MATLGNTYLNLADVFKQQEGDGTITSTIIELLAETNPILDDMLTVECNNGTNHLTTVRTGIPIPTWRKLYGGVAPTKSTTAQVQDTTGMLEAYSEIDKRLLNISGDPARLRLNEAAAHLEGMNQEVAAQLFDMTRTLDGAPERFMGFPERFGALSSTPGTIGNQIVDAGGSDTDMTSVWFVVWGERTVHALYPKGTMAGLQREDLGEDTKVNSDSSMYQVKREHFQWDIGLSVRDWRYVVRIANIDTSALQAGTVDMYKLMRQAYYKLYQRTVTGGRSAIYCNRDVLEALDADAVPTKSSTPSATGAEQIGTAVRLRPGEVDGREVMMYRGMPVRQVDAITNTETQVS